MLAIDTCGATGYVAVFAIGGWTVAAAEREIAGRETQERLMVAVAEVLAEAGLGLQEVGALAVVSGPGSFTGVRIGMAAVKGFAEALQVPVVALSRLAVLAAAGVAERDGAMATVHAWLHAGRGDVFAGRYRVGRTGLHVTEEAMLTREAALAQVMAGEPIFVSEGVLAESLPGTILVEGGRIRSRFRGLAEDGFVRQSFADVALLDAHYLRVPDAELALRARQRTGLALPTGSDAGGGV